MTTYWSILEKIPGSKLRLTKIDDDIHEHFLKEFPDYDLKSTINEDEMKSKAGKEKWRTFIASYENKVDDYNFGTMLRANAAEEYDQDGTIFGRLWERSLIQSRATDRDVVKPFACSSMLLRSRGRFTDHNVCVFRANTHYDTGIVRV